MSRLTPAQLVFIARQHYDAGRVADAEALCRKVLIGDPRRTDAMHLAGLAAEKQGKHDVAMVLIRRAVAAAPQEAKYHADLARIYRNTRQLDAAIACYHRALAIAPNASDVLSGLADVLNQKGQFDEAISLYQQALMSQPESAEILESLGDAFFAADRAEEAVALFQRAMERGAGGGSLYGKWGAALHRCAKYGEAIEAYRQALLLNPNLPGGHDRLGVSLEKAGLLDEAVVAFEQAISHDPQDAQAFVHLGNALWKSGATSRAFDQYHQAILLRPNDEDIYAQIGEALKKEGWLEKIMAARDEAIARRPADAQAYVALGVAMQRRRDADGAIEAYRAAIQIDPNSVAALNNLGVMLKDTGQLDEAIECARKAVATETGISNCLSNLLYMLHFHPAYDAEKLHKEHDAFRQRHVALIQSQHRTHDNDRSPDRRLRIGYVSPNFYAHPVGRFMAAFFPYHDHEKFEVVCYTSARAVDSVTAKIRQGADLWVEVSHLSDASLADRIRADRIDILIDLAMHMAHSRLLAFARKPAPIQMTYLAYCSTTGVETIDYRITDPYLDTPGADDRHYAERSVHLPETYWCYSPGIDTPSVNELPALEAGHVTFASLNNFCKVSPATLAVWMKLLHAVPNSRLLFHMCQGRHRARVLDTFAADGIDPKRIEFFHLMPLPDYFALHHRIDIALDPFPYTGGTTTCDALWMGVPTISLFGSAAYMRSGLSILTNVGLPELAVATEEQYLETAVALANDRVSLAEMRRSMRERMQQSPLMDGERFARNLEGIYRSAWREWVRTKTAD